MKTLLLKPKFLTLVFFIANLFFANVAFGQAPIPTIATDLLDYPPGATAIITGSGFQRGEYIELHVHHADGDPMGTDPEYHEPWFVTADSSGNFETTWYVPTEAEGDALGATFSLEAHGNMGSAAQWTFTDGNSVTFNTPTQSGTVNTGVGGSVTYSFTVTRDNAGNTFTSIFSTNGLPAGVTPSFSPGSFTFAPNASLPLGLTLTVASTVPAGTYNFTVSGTSGTSGTITLIVSGCVAPSITATNIAPVNNALNSCTASVTMGGNITVTAGNPSPIITYSLTSGGASILNPYPFPVGMTNVFATATNTCGSNTKSFTVTVVDNTAPVAIAQNLTVTLDATGNGSTTAASVNNGSSDACGIATLALSKTDFTCANVGPNTVTLTVTDVNGNSSTATATVTVEDKIAPVATAQNVTVQLDATGNGSTTAAAVNNGSSDACGIATLALSQTDFTCANVGPNTVTLTVTDNNGNVSTTTATVTVADTVKPTVVTQNITVQLNASGAATITAAQINNGSTDNCSIASYSLDITSFDCTKVGANTVTLTVTDVNGNSDSKTATVTVEDKVAPVVIAQNVTVQLDALGNGSITAAAVNNGSSDACGIATLALSKTDFTCANVGANTVTLTVTDVNGNVSTATVTVEDKIAPVAIAQNITVQLDATGNGSTTAAAVNNGSSDACGIATLVLSQTDFTCNNVGPNTVTLTLTDVNGNVSTATATVTVEDRVAPVINCKASTSKFVEADKVYYTVLGTEFDAEATDACGIASLVYKINNGTASTVLTLAGIQLQLGTNTIEWSTVDLNGNSSKCSTIITVLKRETTLVYSGDLNEQYSDITDLKATLTDNVSGLGIEGKTIKFAIGSQFITGKTNSSGVATAILKLTQSPIPTYNVVTTFAEDAGYLGSTDTDVFDIQQENAVVEYTGQEFVGEQNATATTTPVLLSASINDIIDGLGLEGNVTNARVQFFDINSNSSISGWLTPGLVTPGITTNGIVNFTWNATVPNTGYESTTIGIRVGTQSPEDNGYYIGSTQTVINVYRVSLAEFITGGGHIIPTDSKGEYASDSNKKINFGFNVKWNKSVKNLQGNLNLIFRRGGKLYQIKSTAMTSLSVISTNPCSQKATFTSKANLTDVTNSTSPISIYGGISLQVTMTDNGEPGKSDMIGITLMNGNNLVYSSSWPINKTAETFLNGGNLVVHNGVKCTITGTTTTAITSTKNPSTVGDLVIFKATVTGAGTPTGNITFYDGSSQLGTAVAISTVNGISSASYSTTALISGGHTIYANYSGDSKFLNSIGSLIQTVNSLSTVKTTTVKGPVVIIEKKELSELEPFSITAYPNPSTQYFIIDIKGGSSEKIEVLVYDMLGRIVKQIQNNTNQEIKFGEEFSAGSYLAIIKQGDQQKTVRLIKK